MSTGCLPQNKSQNNSSTLSCNFRLYEMTFRCICMFVCILYVRVKAIVTTRSSTPIRRCFALYVHTRRVLRFFQLAVKLLFYFVLFCSVYRAIFFLFFVFCCVVSCSVLFFPVLFGSVGSVFVFLYCFVLVCFDPACCCLSLPRWFSEYMTPHLPCMCNNVKKYGKNNNQNYHSDNDSIIMLVMVVMITTISIIVITIIFRITLILCSIIRKDSPIMCFLCPL